MLHCTLPAVCDGVVRVSGGICVAARLGLNVNVLGEGRVEIGLVVNWLQLVEMGVGLAVPVNLQHAIKLHFVTACCRLYIYINKGQSIVVQSPKTYASQSSCSAWSVINHY